MNKKFNLIICLAAVVSMIIGCFIGLSVFRTSFIVYDHNNSIISYSVQFGKIVAGSTRLPSDVSQDDKPLEINLDNVHTNKKALTIIKDQVEKAGGHIIAVHY